MILESFAALNLGLGAFDAYLTRRRIKEYGPKVEMNRAVRWLSTLLGPTLAAIWGVFGPCVGWTYCFYFFKWGLPLAFLTGYNLKRFFNQMASIALERDARMHQLLKELGSGNGDTLPPDESTSKPDPSDSK